MRRPAPRIALPAVLAVLLAVLVLATGCGSLSAYDVKLAAASVQSNSAEAAFTARGAAKGEATAAFTRTHAAELARTAGAIARQLSGAPADRKLTGTIRALTRISTQTASELKRLAASPSHRRVAASVAARCAALAEQAKKLAGG